MKARLLAVLLVSTLVLASTAPVVLAQAIIIEGDNDNDNDRDTRPQFVDCSQVQNAFTGQYAGDNAEIAQELNITQSQVSDCLGGQPDGNNNGDDEADTNEADTNEADTNDVEANALEDGENDVLAGTDPGGTLPDTGGPSLLAAVAGVALIVGGASLIRTGRGR